MEGLSNTFKKLQKLNRWLIGAILVGIVVVVFLQTFCRFVIFKSLTWSEELSRFLFVALIALGINLATTDHLFVRIEIIDNYVKGKASFILSMVRRILATIVSFMFVYSSWKMIAIGHAETRPAMLIPMGIMYGIVFIGFLLNGISIIIDTYEYVEGYEAKEEKA